MTLETMMQREVMLGNIEQQMEDMTREKYGKSIAECSDSEVYSCVMNLVKEMIKATPAISGDKKVYYISAEFLIGKLLSNNLINLRLYDKVDEILKKNGKNLADIEEAEVEPSLGNGGLGRLAACFLDSIATLGMPGAGIGLNYHFGLFKQVFKDLQQCAVKDQWINDQSWLHKTDVSYDVVLAGKTYRSVMYDIDVVGYNNGINKLHLFDLDSVDESIVGDGITFDLTDIEKNLTLFLYPDDSGEDGKLLRIYQQYFMVSNGAQRIIDDLEAQKIDLHQMYDHAVIQINDTHPTMVIPELIRILTEQKGFKMNEAIRVVSNTCAYTNHTILAEALEKWPVDYLERVVPQLMPIIRELDRQVARKYPGNKNLWVIDDDDRVCMAHIDIHYGFSVNGVAALHTEILKNTALHDFYEVYPEKFNNKTNGITFRRWLISCNRELTELIANTIGESYKKDSNELERLLDHMEDEGFLEAVENVKKIHKKKLAEYILKKEGIELDTDSVYDIQIKRLHEYKRQQMNALYIINRYLDIKDGKLPDTKVTFIFGAKAAPAYDYAQDIIHLILVLSQIINNDPVASKYMKVVMVENYNVSYAEKLIPACDISEQISLASQEASGTGNMKFMLNGAVTLGTEDGANVEIHELVGDDNIYIFGKDADTIQAHYKNKTYKSREYYEGSAVIKRAVDFITSPEALAVGNEGRLNHLKNRLVDDDWFMTLIDLEDYIRVKDKALKDYNDRASWRRKSLINIAKAGFFSSDRTIYEYNRDIWKIQIETDRDRD